MFSGKTQTLPALAATLAVIATATPGRAAPADTKNAATDLAARFGALESISNPALSPDGKRVVYVSPGKGGATRVVVGELAGNVWRVVLEAEAGGLRPARAEFESYRKTSLRIAIGWFIVRPSPSPDG